MAPTESAQEALRLAEADPRRAVAFATDLVTRARAEADPVTESIAERALGDATLYLDDLDTSLGHLRAALRLGIQSGSVELATDARIRLAFVLVGRGRPRQAMREIRTALADASGVTTARALAQQAAIFNQLGRLDEAYAGYRMAIPMLRRAGDEQWLCRTLYNRAVLRGYRYEFNAAETDLREAEELCARLDLSLSQGFVQQNLGWISTVRGDVPAALHSLHQAEERFLKLGTHVGEVLLDRARLLLSVNMISEARQAAEDAVEHLGREQRQIELPEARLVLGRAATLEGDHARSRSEAGHAVREFVRQDRPEWAELARAIVLASRLATERHRASPPAGAPRPRSLIGPLERTADTLTLAGWRVESQEVRLLAGRHAIDQGEVARGCRQLRQVGRARNRGPAVSRVRAWHAEALLRLASGNQRGAISAIRSALRVLDEHRATLGATDLRAHASRYRFEVAELGLRIAIDGGRPGKILEWAEQGRASHLLMRPVRPPDDEKLADAFAELRLTTYKITQARESGGPGKVSVRLTNRQLALEREIRDYCRLQRGDDQRWNVKPASVQALSTVLGDAALLEFVQLDGELHAVTIIDGRVRLRYLGPLAEIRNLIDRIPFALHRLARQRASDQSRSAAEAMLRHAAARLDTVLLGPFRAELADRPLVLVPTGPLQSLPWPILPSCTGRAVTISPSATLWLSGHAQREPGKHITVAAGPDLPWATSEALSVAQIHHTDALVGPDATVTAVISALNGASLVHLAAHGRIHPTNPLFSALRFADGPLTVYDLERLDQAPRLVILAACDLGRPVIKTGDELLGLSATLLAQGTQQIIASVMPVPDAQTAPLMIAFHQQLSTGRSAATALAAAQQQQLSSGDPATRAAAAGFICLGTDQAR